MSRLFPVSYPPSGVLDVYGWGRSDLVTLVAGNVDVIIDKSGRGDNYTAPNAGLRPAYSPGGGVHGLPVVQFRTTSALATTVDPNGATFNVPGTWVMVVRMNSAPAAGNAYQLFGPKNATASLFNDFIVANIGGYQEITFKANTGGGAPTVGFTPSTPLGTVDVHDLIFTYDGSGNNTTPSSYAAYLDGVAQTVVASGPVGIAPTNQGSLGGMLDNTNALSNGMDADWYESFIYRKQLSASDVASLRSAYLIPRYH